MSANSRGGPDPAEPFETATVLLVDDDEDWAWATAQVLEREAELTVETAHSLAASKERYAARDFDCVVCDYDLGDGDGLTLLDAVRDADPDRPFVLVTGKGDETVASDAIKRGVTDYIRKGQPSEDTLLVNRVRNLLSAYRAERAERRHRRTKTAALDVLRNTTSVSELAREFCRRLVDSDAYALAWIGIGEDDIVPRASAGVDGYLEAFQDGVELPPDEPASQAYQAAEPVVKHVSAGKPTDGWEKAAADSGFERVIATPIQYQGITFGVLAVYLAGGTGDATERQVIEEYAESLGYALRSLHQKRSMLATEPLCVEVTVADPEAPLVAVADHLPTVERIESHSVVLRSDGSTAYNCVIAKASPQAVRSAIESIPTLQALDVSRSEEGVRCSIRTSRSTPEGVLVDYGARFERTVVDDGTASISVALREDRPITELAEVIGAAFDNTTVSVDWGQSRPDTLPENPFADLTDKQRRVLRHAYHEGYFERPRGSNATEIADRLGISRQTFAQHLRVAQSKVFGTWQGDQ